MSKELIKEFKKDLATASSVDSPRKEEAIKSLQNLQMSSGRRLLNSVDDKELVQFLLREQISLRMTKWILNKAIIQSREHGGIGRYLEKLVVKDLHLKQVEKEIGNQLNEKELSSKRGK